MPSVTVSDETKRIIDNQALPDFDARAMISGLHKRRGLKIELRDDRYIVMMH